MRELDFDIIDFVWNGKKHEVSKELLCAFLENGGLGLTKITNKIFAQRIAWLSKLYNMDQNCFTRVIAEERIGNFDAEYKGFDFLKGDLNLLKVQSSDDFYNELLQVSRKFKFEYEVGNEEQQKSELSFYNPRILDGDGNPYKSIEELTRVRIFRARDLIFKTKQKNYNKNVFLKIKEIKDRMKSLQNDQPVTEECPLKISLEGKLVPFWKEMVRSVYQELQKERV